jgi:hypothetical protein
MTKYKVRIRQEWEAEVLMDAEDKSQAIEFALEYASERPSMFNPDGEMKIELVLRVEPLPIGLGS